MNNKIIFLVIMTLIFIVIGLTGQNIFGENEYKKDPLPVKISQLPDINLSDVETYEQYKKLADSINNLILLLNKEADLNIPLFKTSQESWEEVSKKINKYGPLINNYQELVNSAKKFEKNKNKENYKKFYLNLGKFSLETTLISVTLFHRATFQSVGYLYRASGLNILALKCSTCVSIVLSGAYWNIKTVLVEESSKIADKLINELKNFGEQNAE